MERYSASTTGLTHRFGKEDIRGGSTDDTFGHLGRANPITVTVQFDPTQNYSHASTSFEQFEQFEHPVLFTCTELPRAAYALLAAANYRL